MIGIQLEPVDTWFFRSGTPFTKDNAPQDNVESLFPPHPATVVGALRAALALDNGWDGRGRWPRGLDEVLGDGPDDLGALSFDGPFLLRNEKPLFRAPRHLLGLRESDGWTPRALLRPGPPVACDLGDAIRLPEPPGAASDSENIKPGEGQWLTQAGMNAVLLGSLPHKCDVVSDNCLWSVEPRIGLKRDRSLRSAEEGMLYSTRHVRARRGVSLGARLAGLPYGWRPPFGRLLSLGGESRLAECRKWDADAILGAPSDSKRVVRRVALIALSPLDVEDAVVLGERPLADLSEARVVSACLDRPLRIGGWDSLARCPLPLRSVLPAGSVLFCEIPGHSPDGIPASDGMVRLGSRREWGFGLVALGAWPDDRETRNDQETQT